MVDASASNAASTVLLWRNMRMEYRGRSGLHWLQKTEALVRRAYGSSGGAFRGGAQMQ